MDKLKEKLKNRNTLLSLSLLTLLALIFFLPKVSSLGFYRDDWHVVWGALTNGIHNVAEQHNIDRPFLGLVYSWVFSLLGANPLVWNVFAVFVRFVGAVIFFYLLRILFPEQKKLPFYLVLVFLIYPGFLQLPNGNTYQGHIIALDSGLFSILLTLLVLKQKNLFKKLLLAGFSGLFGAACYFMFEWMIGLEAVRFLLIFYVLWMEEPKIKGYFVRFLQNYLAWLLNLLAFGGFMFWRIFIFDSYRAATNVGALGDRYLSNLIPMLTKLMVELGKDILDTVVFAWFVPLYNYLLDARYADLFWSLLIGLLAVGLVLLYVRLSGKEKSSFLDEDRPAWANGFILFGLLAVAVSLLPEILAEREVRYLDTLDRYTMTSMLGVAFVLIGLLARFVKPQFRSGLLCLFVFLSALTHYHNAVYFADFWEYQKQVWWQFSWRAPAVEEQTVLLVQLPGRYQLAEGYEVWAPANLIYFPHVSSIGIVSDTFSSETAGKILSGAKDSRNVRTVWFERDFENTLILSLDNPEGCLHVMDPEHPEIWLRETPLLTLTAAYSKPERILTEGEPVVPQLIFGDEPQKGWCYAYQTASLELQKGNIAAVQEIWENVSGEYAPSDPGELFPFLEAALEGGYSNTIEEISSKIQADTDFLALYCGFSEYNNQNSESLLFETLCEN